MIVNGGDDDATRLEVTRSGVTTLGTLFTQLHPGLFRCSRTSDLHVLTLTCTLDFGTDGASGPLWF